jgi:hypothetical protein
MQRLLFFSEEHMFEYYRKAPSLPPSPIQDEVLRKSLAANNTLVIAHQLRKRLDELRERLKDKQKRLGDQHTPPASPRRRDSWDLYLDGCIEFDNNSDCELDRTPSSTNFDIPNTLDPLPSIALDIHKSEKIRRSKSSRAEPFDHQRVTRGVKNLSHGMRRRSLVSKSEKFYQLDESGRKKICVKKTRRIYQARFDLK